MRLPDFTLHEPLNALKRQMGMRDNEFGLIARPAVCGKSDLGELPASGEDVHPSEIVRLLNGTNVYKGNRVLIYIRDIRPFRGKLEDPRYHLTSCKTLVEMEERKAIDRYVVATRQDGLFQVNVISGGPVQAEERRLKVCRFCLDQLHFKGFSLDWTSTSKREFVESFSPMDFFNEYPRSPLTHFPRYDANGAPLNDYTIDFADISRRMRAAKGWKCSECEIVLSTQASREFLHVHHRDGNRWNNAADNLKVVCIGCHAQEHNHGHLKDLAKYTFFTKAHGRKSAASA